MVYSITDNNLHIYDSYAISKWEFRKHLLNIWGKHIACPVFKRSIFSLSMEWAAHNFCYAIGYKRERTADVDLNYPQKWYARIGYAVVGVLVWCFIG